MKRAKRTKKNKHSKKTKRAEFSGCLMVQDYILLHTITVVVICCCCCCWLFGSLHQPSNRPSSPTASYLSKTKQALVPPKPKLLEATPKLGPKLLMSSLLLLLLLLLLLFFGLEVFFVSFWFVVVVFFGLEVFFLFGLLYFFFVWIVLLIMFWPKRHLVGDENLYANDCCKGFSGLDSVSGCLRVFSQTSTF